jgi:hypothetical protein
MAAAAASSCFVAAAPTADAFKRQSLTHWNAAQVQVDEEGTMVPYANVVDLLIDQLEEATPLATDLCKLIVDLMDVREFAPVPRGAVANMPPQRLERPQTGSQIRFRGGGCLLFPKECIKTTVEHPLQSPEQRALAQSLADGCNHTAQSKWRGQCFLFYREFPFSFELLAQDGLLWRSSFRPHYPNDLLEPPLKEQNRRLRVFYQAAGRCEHRMRPCKEKIDPECENACCSSAHCSTFAIHCPHHDGEQSDVASAEATVSSKRRKLK